ncbi:diacylglycerol/lipid kinase family protein [Sabulicella rubraurantiaca]|uniref:diacylglycerol/lipid kinase family protein n=1 Tax=Sabulicella rubraurantiaca TaxID=2811429 RepID=UPI001A961D75|nr:diacylglycerol kinase family protein [Sabulicella rubraurantiaca]
MKAALLLNPLSGRLSRMEAPRAAIEAAMHEAGFIPVPIPDGTLDEQWDAAREAGAEAMFIAGGDGTLRAFVTRLIAARLPCALLPGGTMNRVCLRLGLPEDPVEAARLYRPLPPEGMDVGSVNGEPMLYQSIVGRPARLLRFREMQRAGGSWWPLLVTVCRNLFRPPWRDVIVPLAPATRATGLAAVVTMPAPGDGPSLTLQLIQPAGPGKRLRLAWRWFRGRLAEDASVITLHGSRFAVHGRARLLRVSLDGEMRVLMPPLRFRLIPLALAVLPRA